MDDFADGPMRRRATPPKGGSALAVFAIAAGFYMCSKPEPDRLPPPAHVEEAPAAAPAPKVEEQAVAHDYVSEALKHPRAIVLGDSIMHYSDELVSRRLEEAMADGLGPEARASVKGVTKGGQLINGWIGSQFDKHVRDPAYNIIVLQGGVNDIGWWGKTGHTKIRDQAFARLSERYEAMVKAALDNGKVIVLVTVSPWKGQVTWNAVGQEETEELNSWMKAQAGRKGVFVADTYSVLVAKDPACESERDSLARGYRGGDVQHPNDEGKKAIGEVIALSLGYQVPSITPPRSVRSYCR